MPLILRTSCYPCHQVTASEVDPGTNNLMSCRDCRFWAKIGGWKVENLWHYGVDLQGQNSDMMYIYILSSRWTDRCPIPKLSTFRLAKQKKTGTFCLFSFTLQPQKKTKLPKQKKKKLPHTTSPLVILSKYKANIPLASASHSFWLPQLGPHGTRFASAKWTASKHMACPTRSVMKVKVGRWFNSTGGWPTKSRCVAYRSFPKKNWA